MGLSIGGPRPAADDAQQDRVATPGQVLIPIIKEHNHVSSHFRFPTRR